MISSERLDRLRQDWVRLLDSYGVAADAAGPAFDRLATAYSEPHRHYHTLEHLAEMFEVLDRLGVNAPAVRLAVWYHDAVYDTRAADNELRSADLAVRELTALDLSAGVIEEVRELILATDHRKPPPSGGWKTGTLLDADLAVLGSPADRYERYASDIRKEYDWVPDAAYRAGRVQVLQGFLDRPRIYTSISAFDAFEVAARSNIAAELARLVQKP